MLLFTWPLLIGSVVFFPPSYVKNSVIKIFRGSSRTSFLQTILLNVGFVENTNLGLVLAPAERKKKKFMCMINRHVGLDLKK